MLSDMDSSRPTSVDESTDTPLQPVRPKRRRISKRMQELIAWQNRVVPAIEQTLRELETLSTKRYETKARTRNAIRNATLALRDTLEMLHSYSAHESLVSRSTVQELHRRIRERVALDVKPKRKRRAE